LTISGDDSAALLSNSLFVPSMSSPSRLTSCSAASLLLLTYSLRDVSLLPLSAVSAATSSPFIIISFSSQSTRCLFDWHFGPFEFCLQPKT